MQRAIAAQESIKMQSCVVVGSDVKTRKYVFEHLQVGFHVVMIITRMLLRCDVGSAPLQCHRQDHHAMH